MMQLANFCVIVLSLGRFQAQTVAQLQLQHKKGSKILLPIKATINSVSKV